MISLLIVTSTALGYSFLAFAFSNTIVLSGPRTSFAAELAFYFFRKLVYSKMTHLCAEPIIVAIIRPFLLACVSFLRATAKEDTKQLLSQNKPRN